MKRIKLNSLYLGKVLLIKSDTNIMTEEPSAYKMADIRKITNRKIEIEDDNDEKIIINKGTPEQIVLTQDEHLSETQDNLLQEKKNNEQDYEEDDVIKSAITTNNISIKMIETNIENLERLKIIFENKIISLQRELKDKNKTDTETKTYKLK